MGKNKNNKKSGKGAEKTALKTARNAERKLQKTLETEGEESIETLIAQFVENDKKKLRVAEDLVEPPSQRVDCSLLANPDKDLLYLFGGSYYDGKKCYVYNDLFTYNIKKQTWLKLCAPVMPPPRCSHQAVIVAQGGGEIWLFGGEFTTPSQNQFYHYKDLWCYHIQAKQWEKVNAEGGPSARSGHRMITNGKEIFLFGGFHESLSEGKYFDDLYKFTLLERKWTKFAHLNLGPSPRSAVHLTFSDNKLLLYGGYGKVKKGKYEEGIIYSDMFRGSEDQTGKWRWSQVKQGGSKPVPRAGMAITTGPGNRAYLFGGVIDQETEISLKPYCLNDFYILECSKGLWKQVTLEKKDDVPKTDDCLASQIDQLNVDPTTEDVKTDGIFTVKIASGPATSSAGDQRLSELKTDPNKPFFPSPRMKPCLAIKHGLLYLYGGLYETGDKHCNFRDMYCIDLHKMDQWKTLIAMDPKDQELIASDTESEADDSDTSDSVDSSD